MILRNKPLVTASVFTIIGIIFGLAISTGFNLNSKGYSQETRISKESIETLSKLDSAISEVAAAVKPSVVNISSTKTVKNREAGVPFPNDPFFKRFFGEGPFDRQRQHKQSGLGSGVIVDKNGYVLTNNHVIRDADEIKVKLSDQREFKGKVIGTDQKTDLAVIKVEAEDLPAIRIADSDSLKVGSMVLAVGNPFGLNQTVTSGIVSAVGRANVGIADYEDFIQTDAAINPGNSGGALVNIRGELVGINTAILSTTGGYQGIGFAIPSSMAKNVMDSLIRTGKVVRGWIGVSIQPMTPDLAKQFNLKDGEGILVGDVVEDGPAAKAGIERGDVITEFDGKQIREVTVLRNMVAGTAPGKIVKVGLIRDGKPKNLEIKVSEQTGESGNMGRTFENLLKGVAVQDITPSIRSNLDIPKRIYGVIITDVSDDSPAEGILMKDDVIMEINKRQIRDVKDYESVMGGIRTGEVVLALVHRKTATFYVTITAK
ncbi:MAG TPA: DegQ family serine endoprotease [Thermodesulfovibrionales bacterium]|nr:DegQ family serine endoprotease [Thermodesulfovibrionales bacterium]